MSERGVEEFLHSHPRVGLDTNVLIFQLEENPKYIHLVDLIFAWLERPGSHAVTSTLTMLELLVLPYRRLDSRRVGDCFAFLSTYPHLEWIAPTLEIAAHAARLRAEHHFSTPDAIQAATALTSGARGFISNAVAFKRLSGLDVLILEDFV